MSGVELIRRLTFPWFPTTDVLRCCFSLGFVAMFGMSKKSCFSFCVFVRNCPTRWVFGVTMDMCAFTHEHSGTRLCTIRPCSPTHNIWISLATVCVFFRVTVDALC